MQVSLVALIRCQDLKWPFFQRDWSKVVALHRRQFVGNFEIVEAMISVIELAQADTRSEMHQSDDIFIELGVRDEALCFLRDFGDLG